MENGWPLFRAGAKAGPAGKKLADVGSLGHYSLLF
jgi:hypothetical protein